MARSASEIAQYLGLELHGDPKAAISGIASPEDAGPEDLIYIESSRHAHRAESSRAVCVLAQRGTSLKGKTVLTTPNPKLAFSKAAAWLVPETRPAAGIHKTAVVDPSARLAKSATIGAYVVIEQGVSVGDDTWIEPFCFIGSGNSIGANCRLHPHVTLYAGSMLRDRVEIHSGAVIGGDGFGYVFAEGRQWKFPQAGKVILENDVEIGCSTTIDRGSLGITEIKEGVKIDNLVQVAHNVKIGEHSIIVSQVGISGSSNLGKGVVVGGQAGFGERAIVEDNAVIGGQSGVLPGKVVRSGQTVWGTPARAFDRFKEQHAWLGRLADLARRLRIVEAKLEKNGRSE